MKSQITQIKYKKNQVVLLVLFLNLRHLRLEFPSLGFPNDA